MSQDTYLFNESLRENIRMARPDADEEALSEAVSRAALEDFVGALPEDGVEDERRESYRVVRPAGAPGVHVVVVRGHDGSGNVSSVRLRFEAQP